jgi:hypothetical protein
MDRRLNGSLTPFTPESDSIEGSMSVSASPYSPRSGGLRLFDSCYSPSFCLPMDLYGVGSVKVLYNHSPKKPYKDSSYRLLGERYHVTTSPGKHRNPLESKRSYVEQPKAADLKLNQKLLI